MQTYKDLLRVLGFLPKENAVDVYAKTYPAHHYTLEVDFKEKKINYGSLIRSESKTTQNFSQAENWVVLECVDRLLTKGYAPTRIILEKTWPAGHGTSGRLDICVTREKDDSEYLLIECKTYGKEFDKAVAKMYKDGDQLFTYFKFSNKADVIALYTSQLQDEKVVYKNEIVKIEEDYKAGNVQDFYEKWNKLTKDNGIFESWVTPYCFKSKALVKEQLKPIEQEDSSFIFNRFLEILRHNVVSDKGNAFNKIFTLFLCKVYDETTKKDGQELDFQWKEGQDTHEEFQLRLTDLYKKGMLKFLSRTVSDFDNDDFEKRCHGLSDDIKNYLLKEMEKVRLEKNNEFAIKEVYDHDSFVENAKIVKEVVELLQGYRIRYNKRQQYLSDFFELLLTTGLKQEAGQFFTPVPVAQFIIKSLPLEGIINKTLSSEGGDLLPYMIDYAAGSGHFITEYMHEVQDILNKNDSQQYIEETSNQLDNWKRAHYDWATRYVYGVEKDYRLVKVGKVGCYLHGDGLANVILSDGLGNFVKTKDYKGKLRKQQDDKQQDNQQFDVLLSNPPYSVSAFRQTTRDYYTEKDFDLYQYLTDNSSEIECLFVERMKQLLKDGGLAGIILPSSILTNTGIYTKTRELLLKYFEFVAITELGSNTFMATGTNTVVLFLRRRNNYDCVNLQKSVEKFFSTHTDGSINNIEHPISQYVRRVWEGLTFDDYITLLDKNPNEKVQKHDLYREYTQKLTTKKEQEFWNKVLALEKEKLFYFVLAYPQKVVVVRTGEKEAEKRFLGYEFSNRRGAEGIHAIERGKTIEECTQLFDSHCVDNPQKASTYIYKAFQKDLNFPIDDTLKDNVSRLGLLDMMTFDRADFEKVINTKKAPTIRSKFPVESLGKICKLYQPKTISLKDLVPNGKYDVWGANGIIGKYNDFNHENSEVVVTCRGNTCGTVNYTTPKSWITGNAMVISPLDSEKIDKNYLFEILKNIDLTGTITGKAQPQITRTTLSPVHIPLPPLEVQQKIVNEIEKIEAENTNLQKSIVSCHENITEILNAIHTTTEKLGELVLLNETTQNPKTFSTKTFTYVDIDSVQNGTGKISFDKEIDSQKAPSRARRIAHDKSVLISTVRPNLKAFSYIEKERENTIYSTGFAVIRSKDEGKFCSKYLYYLFLYSDNLMEQIKEAMPKGQYPSINDKDMRNLVVPVPSIKDQQRIVAKIEKLEQQIEQAQASIKQSEQQKQTILDKYLK